NVCPGPAPPSAARRARSSSVAGPGARGRRLALGLAIQLALGLCGAPALRGAGALRAFRLPVQGLLAVLGQPVVPTGGPGACRLHVSVRVGPRRLHVPVRVGARLLHVPIRAAWQRVRRVVPRPLDQPRRQALQRLRREHTGAGRRVHSLAAGELAQLGPHVVDVANYSLSTSLGRGSGGLFSAGAKRRTSSVVIPLPGLPRYEGTPAAT